MIRTTLFFSMLFVSPEAKFVSKTKNSFLKILGSWNSLVGNPEMVTLSVVSIFMLSSAEIPYLGLRTFPDFVLRVIAE